MEVISRDGTTAQIDPLRFCQWLLKEVKERGVRIHQPAKATAIIKDAEDVLCGLKISRSDDAESDTECRASIDDLDFSMAADYLQQYLVRISS
jgi:flavin-dependent dehydrogenase